MKTTASNRICRDIRCGKSHLLLKILLFLFLSINFSQVSYARYGKTPFYDAKAKPIKGKITDDKGAPLANVSIIIKGTSKGVTTDANGNFSIEVPDDKSVLVISFVGFQQKEVQVGAQAELTVQLIPDSGQLSDVVVVGYGTQKRVTVTGAVSAVKGDKIIKSPAVDMSNSLAGRLPGLVVIQTSGEPGYDGAILRIRGTNTLGNSTPLTVIDGIPDRDGGIGRLNPRDIEDISVLKDASAAIYGSRAANGVILVTTKRGTIGKPKITYDFNQGWAQPARIPEMANSFEYASIMNEIPIYKTIPVNEWGAAWKSIQETGEYISPTPNVSALNANYSPEAMAGYKAAVEGTSTGIDLWKYPNTDWFGDAFKDWSMQNRHNLSLSGGTENLRYFASLGYVFQDAYYKNSATKYQQYNFRANVTAKVNDYINTFVGIMVRREERHFPTESSGGIFRMLMRGRPTEPEVWPNGLPGPDIENGQNPYVITTNATGYQDNPTDYIQGTGSVEITNPWIKGLKLTLSAGIDKNNSTNKMWQTPWKLYYWDGITYEDDGTPKLVGAVRSNFTDPRLTQNYGTLLNTNFTALLNYDKVIGNHTIGVMAGVTKEKFTGSGFQAFRREYISPAVDQLFAGGTIQTVTGGAYERARLGYYGRVQYNYREKYLAEFLWRYDGSYIFPSNQRFGFFPGLLVGWNIAKEDFFKVSFVNQLKLRASYGEMGNDQVAYDIDGDGDLDLQEYAFLSLYQLGQYPINNQVVTTLYEPLLANPNFTWERAKNFNVGLDATLFKNKIDVILEYFYNKRDQILWRKSGSTPTSAGIGNLLPPENIARVDNRGFEFSVAYNGTIGNNFQFKAGVNGGYAKNKVISMDESPAAPKYQWQTGKPFGAYLVYVSDGVFRDADEIAKNTIDYSGVTSQLIPGDMKFKDVNNDGKITADDQIRLDKSITPTFNFGANIDIRYKNVDLSLLFQGATGAAIRVQTESGDIGNYLKYFYDHRWSIDNPSSTDPRLASRGDTYFTGGNFGNNTYYLFNKDYVRLKNIEVGYTLPQSLLTRFKISNLRFFVNGLNVFTIDKMKVYDPEATVISGVFYPQARVINGGLTVTF